MKEKKQKKEDKIEVLEEEKLINELLQNMEAYNKAIYLIQLSPDSTTRYEVLEDNLSDYYSKDLIKNLSLLKLENKYHRFSEKALKKYLELMKKYNENSSYIERNYQDIIQSDIREEQIKKYLENIKEGELKYINSKNIDNIIASPATKKSLRKAISILNKLFSKYGYPKYICIENTRTLLSPEKQKEYESKTLDNKIKRKNAAKKLEEQGNVVNEANIDKYLLLNETNNRCAYCGKDITVGKCEVEHILPLSITSNNNFTNKTASCTKCNSQKSNKTPFEFLSSIGTYDDFKNRVIHNKNLSQEKKNNLLFEQNIYKLVKSLKNNKNSSLLMYDSLKSYCTRVFKDKENNKLYFMPIYKIFIDNNSKEIRENLEYYKQTFKEYVVKDIEKIEKYMDIFNNEYVRFENKDGSISEGLVSCYDKTNNKIAIKNCQKNITSNTKKIEKIKSDVLGLYNLNI